MLPALLIFAPIFIMTEKIIILDFGSQYTQLIARAVREAQVYCEIQPYHKPVVMDESVKGIILSGSPFSVNDAEAPEVDVQGLARQRPLLGVCYGAQLTAKLYGGLVAKSAKREYGRAFMVQQQPDALFAGISPRTQVWMSHSDSIKELPHGFEVLATTDSIPVAAFRLNPQAPGAQGSQPVYGLQFHPEVYHSTEGKTLLKNFLYQTCGCTGSWTPAHFVTETVAALQQQIGDKKVIMALSGGGGRTFAGCPLNRARCQKLSCLFVENSGVRKE